MGKRNYIKEAAVMEEAFSSMNLELPEDLEQWIRDYPMEDSRYFFCCRKQGVRYGYCTHCERESRLDVTGEREYTPAQLENSRLRHNDWGVCPSCGSRVQFKDAGRGRKYLRDYGNIVVFQPCNNGGMMGRAFDVMRDYSGDYRHVGTELLERNRFYFNADTGSSAAYMLKWVNEQYPPKMPYQFLNRDEAWRRIMLSGTDAIPLNPGNDHYAWVPMAKIPEPFYLHNSGCPVYYYGVQTPDNQFLSSSLRYSEAASYGGESIVKYLELYVKHPVLVERMMKEGWWRLLYFAADQGLRFRGIVNWQKETVPEALGATRKELRLIMESGIQRMSADIGGVMIGVHSIHVLRRAGQPVTKEALNTIAALVFEGWDSFQERKQNVDTIGTVLRVTTVRQIEKYMKKNPKRFGDWCDYIRQCGELGLNLAEAFIRFPQNLQKAHEEATKTLAEQKEAREREAARIIDEAFAGRYKKLCRKYQYESGSLLIRPARGKQELFYEGASLSHCVYTNYADKYLRGETIILLIRQKQEPEQPFYTVELSKTGTIIQCRGKRNCPPTEEVKAFTEKWKKIIEERAVKKQPRERVQIGTVA